MCEDKTLVATVGPSELLGPPGSSLLWSVTWIKNPLVEVLGSFANNVFGENSHEKYQVMGYVTSISLMSE